MLSRRTRRSVFPRLALVLAVVLTGALAVVVGLRMGEKPSGTTESERAADTIPEGPGKAPTIGLPSRHDLRPPRPTIERDLTGQAPGYFFVAPKPVFGVPKVAGQQDGPEIVDRYGRVRWFLPNPAKDDAYDFRAARYEGKPVLSFWQGVPVGGSGRGQCVVLDQSYKEIARVDFHGPHDADIHECQLTARGTMLMTGYETVPGDTSSVGGSKDGKITEGVVKEIDVATNTVKLEWRSLEDGVPISDSYEDLHGHSGPGYDYFHVNSVNVDPTDGNLIISARHTWAEYKINRDTGQLMWKLGGKASDFKMGKGARTAWQHDAVPLADGEIRTFDNATGTSGGRSTYPYSRITWVKLNLKAKTATLVRSLKHPHDVQGGTQGNAQGLANGNTIVGWGSAGVFSEFSPSGRWLFDARVPKGYDTYRAYKAEWDGKPSEAPAVAARRAGGRTIVDASWNGSTEVHRWQIMVAASATGPLAPAGRSIDWSGLDTAMSSATMQPYVAVRALGAEGQVLAESPRVRVA